MTAQHQDTVAEIGKLFAALGEVYGRAREGVAEPATTQVTLRVREEGERAAEIIRRIREIQKF